jgi:hypothetical protein
MPVASIDATEVLLLLHEPPVVASLSSNAAPGHVVIFPAIADGCGVTVNTLIEAQPVPTVYVITVVPEDRAVTAPLARSIVATEALLLLQLPPPVVLLSVVVAPIQVTAVPEIDAGTGLTVTLVATLHPEPRKYEIVTVPAVTPVTIPEVDPTAATDGALLVHVPPPLFDNVVAPPSQTYLIPVIAGGADITVIEPVATQPVLCV